MNFRKSLAAAALVVAASASPAAFAFVRYEPTNPIVQPVHFHQRDVNKDGIVTRSEWKAGQIAFERHDRNHDGVISAADRDIVPANGLDRNRDGVVTRAEWKGNTRSFQVKDRNRDGRLTGTELR
jgi:hypothetical protein